MLLFFYTVSASVCIRIISIYCNCRTRQEAGNDQAVEHHLLFFLFRFSRSLLILSAVFIFCCENAEDECRSIKNA